MFGPLVSSTTHLSARKQGPLCLHISRSLHYPKMTSQVGFSENFRENPTSSSWLVVLTILKNISQWEGLSHILWKIKNVPNHQPDSLSCIILPLKSAKNGGMQPIFRHSQVKAKALISHFAAVCTMTLVSARYHRSICQNGHKGTLVRSDFSHFFQLILNFTAWSSHHKDESTDFINL